MKRAVRSLFRFIAVALVLLGGAELSLTWLRHRAQQPALWLGLSGGILVLLGAALFWIGPRLADRLTRDFDE